MLLVLAQSKTSFFLYHGINSKKKNLETKISRKKSRKKNMVHNCILDILRFIISEKYSLDILEYCIATISDHYSLEIVVSENIETYLNILKITKKHNLLYLQTLISRLTEHLRSSSGAHSNRFVCSIFLE